MMSKKFGVSISISVMNGCYVQDKGFGDASIFGLKPYPKEWHEDKKQGNIFSLWQGFTPV